MASPIANKILIRIVLTNKDLILTALHRAKDSGESSLQTQENIPGSNESGGPDHSIPRILASFDVENDFARGIIFNSPPIPFA